MTFKMSEEAQTIRVFNLCADTKEFIGAGDAYIPPYTGLPAYCTDIEPPESREGYVAVFNTLNETWDLVEDHRGLTVHDTGTGVAIYISDLGPLPDNVTVISPSGEYQMWNGKAWVKDKSAEKTGLIREAENVKNRLMQLVNEKIEPLQDAVDLNMATNDENTQLVELKKYRILLNRIDTSHPETINWPEVPIHNS